MLDRDWILSWAPLGVLESSQKTWTAIGSGVFIYDGTFVWYVTSHHSISDPAMQSLHLLIHRRKGDRILFDIQSVHSQTGLTWVMDEKTGIVATLFPTEPQYNLKAIGFDLFLPMNEMSPGMDCYSIGCPYGLAESDIGKVDPYILKGIISRLDEQHQQVYVSSLIISDNLGGPLFVLKTPSNPQGNVCIEGALLCLGGILIKCLRVQNGNDNGQFPPLHFGVSAPCDAIRKLLNSSKAECQKKIVRDRA